MQPTSAKKITDCDVERELVDSDSDGDVTIHYAGRIPFAAISWKTNAQSNGQKQRIYTSTPRAAFEEQQQRRNDAIGFCNLTKATGKQHNIYVGGAAQGQGPSSDVRLKALLVLFAIVIIGYRIVSLAMPLISSEMVQELGSYVQAQLDAALDWSEEHQLRSRLSPLLCGFLIGSFFYGMVYMDSLEPGVNPPAPFSKRSKQSHRERSSIQLSYLMVIGIGIMVTLMMYLD